MVVLLTAKHAHRASEVSVWDSQRVEPGCPHFRATRRTFTAKSRVARAVRR
nr:hypothetical protein [Kibdelosporangium sp. MJ126-NF4]CTQ98197.1 hypothetical protein [Kibdelosporangium sp. MJ126-NF4]